ncbi:hypothetical protein Q8W71_03205 [Methylobacterium sp. NEAU 140]|uniref:hypothetical protein n=1 Tax=Methylobacterium sp. NEAU 140 TaxID=3064945 RepID=UPI002734FFAF|nr:hypothetical protein [Methylobacterium sp. NEAU 140]MDP4021620.1 hypothetical protein [Methylobacterium sp. NEAU 140]
MNYIKGNIAELGLIVALVAAVIGLMQLVYQIKSGNRKVSSIKSKIAGQERAWINETNELIEEVALVKFTNNGLVPDAVEGARFEVFAGDDAGKWDLLDVVGADKEFQISMPIRLDPAASIEVRFAFSKERSELIKNNRVIFVQKFMRQANESRKEFAVRYGRFTFPDDGAET